MLNKRLWVSIAIALFFVCLVASGLVLFLVPYNTFFSGVHVWLAFGFITIVVLHFSNNYRSLLSYLKRRLSLLVIFIAGLLLLTVVIAVYYRVKPFSTVLDFSSRLRNTAVVTEGRFQLISIGKLLSGRKLIIEVKAGGKYRDRPTPFLFGKIITSPPQMAFWIEDMEGNYVRTLYVTSKTGYPVFYPYDRLRSGTVYRQESFPYWLHKRAKAYSQEDFAPEVDAVTGATPHGHFNIEGVVPDTLRKFRVLAEINRSFDFNDYYSKDRYPDDPIYSGDGYPGQPSIIYATTVDLDSDDKVYAMKTIGHGHYSGNDGMLYTDMTGIDSALKIIQRIIVEIQ